MLVQLDMNSKRVTTEALHLGCKGLNVGRDQRPRPQERQARG